MNLVADTALYHEDSSDSQKTGAERIAIAERISNAVTQHMLSAGFERSDFTIPTIVQHYNNAWVGDTHFDEDTNLIQRTIFHVKLTRTDAFYLNVMIIRSYTDRQQRLYYNKFRVFVRNWKNYDSQEIACKEDIFAIKALRKRYKGLI